MPYQLGAVRWREDLDHLVEGLQREHRCPFHRLSPAAFGDAVRALRARIPSLADHEVVVELSRLLAMVGDGHTALRLADIPGFGRYPLALYRYSDGLFLRAIDRAIAEAAGARLLAIDDTPAEEAYDAMRPVVSRDNEMGVRAAAPALLAIGEVLHARGVAARPDRATFRFELRGGERSNVLLRSSPEGLPADAADARDGAEAPLPLWLRRSPEENGLEYLPDSRTLYLALNRVRDRSEPLTELFDRAFRTVEQHAAERLILDIRLNHGGNNALNRPLIHHLIRSDRINRWGGFFAVVGRQTFSAAMNLAVDLERHTRVLFVGEPTGSSPNHFGENAEVVLPHSGLRASVSALWWQHSAPYDDRPWIAPDIPARLASTDYAANRDPAVDAALGFAPGSDRFVEYPDRLAAKLRRDDLQLSPVP
jgi:hypothetical protein